MDTKIYTIPMGFDQCYVLKSDGIIAIDAGQSNKIWNFLHTLEKVSIKPSQIKLLVITHGHWDHIGSAKAIRDNTGAQIVMHHLEAEWLENSLKQQPPGVTLWGRIFTVIISLFLPLVKIPAVEVDLKLSDAGLSLQEYGIPGKIIHTPGHSRGSTSVLLESGEVFVGDLAMNKFPLRLSPGLPIFADDMEIVRASWKNLLQHGAKIIYPAHGKPFSADIIRDILQID